VSPLRPWLDVASKPVVILSKDRTFVGSVVTICDLRRGGVCDRSIPSVSYLKHWSWMLARRSHGPVYFDAADVGFQLLMGSPLTDRICRLAYSHPLRREPAVFESHTGPTGSVDCTLRNISLVCSTERRPAVYFGHLGKDLNRVPWSRRLLRGYDDRLRNLWSRLADCQGGRFFKGDSRGGVATGASWTAGRLEPELGRSRAGDV
jgi:hypothetical protein